VLLHEDAVAGFIAVLETFNAAVEKSKAVSDGTSTSQKRRFSSTLSLSSISSAVNKPARNKGLVLHSSRHNNSDDMQNATVDQHCFYSVCLAFVYGASLSFFVIITAVDGHHL